MLSSIGQQPSNQTLRVVDRDRLVVQRVRVKAHDKLISKTAATSSPQQNVLDNAGDLLTDFNFSQNSNNDELLDLGNSLTSSFLREVSGDDRALWEEEKKNTSPYYKTINGFGYYSCDSCPFLCLNTKLFLEHNEKDHLIHHAPLKYLLRTKCIGCENIFYSLNVLRWHLIEDHDVLSLEVDKLIQLVVEANKEDTLFINGDNDFVDNFHSNGTSENFWDYQEQVFDGLQENNSSNDNNTIEKRLRCTFRTCKVKFQTEENLRYHIKCHSNDGYKCAECECQYTDNKWLSMMSHLWKIHSIDLEMFSCNQCGFKTNSLYKLNTFHKKIHKIEKPFVCEECSKGFKSIKQLRNHKAIHKKNEKPQRTDLTCLHCTRDFSTKNLLHQHISSIHIRARPHSCVVCGYTTAVISSLRLHMRTHTGEKPFRCEECGYSTADHNTLRKHKMRHTGQKNYTCPLCNYSCIQASSYKKHLKTKHPGMDDGIIYSCDMCNFKTIRKDMYMIHIVKHKEERLQNNGICETLVNLDEIINEKEKIQAEINEQPYLFNTIRVKPLNSMKPDEIMKKVLI